MGYRASPQSGHPGDPWRSVTDELEEAVGDLVLRFGDQFDEPTIRAVLRESYEKVASTARARGYPMVLAMHRAADQLRARRPRGRGTPRSPG
jgi:hypothetical protein